MSVALRCDAPNSKRTVDNMNAPFEPNAAHAVYAPSSAKRWMACTASATAIAQLGEQEEGEEAAEGTRAHDEIERCLGHLNGKQYPVPDATPHPVDPEHPAAYGVGLVLDYVRQLPTGTLWIEQRVRLTDDIWGRCDVAHWHAESATLTIVDYKNGYVNVEAERNEQLLIYAAASAYTYELPVKYIRLVVVQPNSFLPVPRVKQWITTAADLYEFANRAAAVPTGPLEFRAGEQCKYCPMFGQCPASQDVLAALQYAIVNPPDRIQPQQVATFAAMKKPVEDWFKALEKAQTKQIMKGTDIPGMKLVQTNRHRAWINEATARATIIDEFGYEALNLPTPAQVEKMGLDVSNLSEKPEGGPALAFDTDARPTWKPKTAKDMFAKSVEAMK